MDIDYDVAITEERLWDLFVSYCGNRGEKPTIKKYIEWFEENYGL
jgi:hypothetical protein